MFKYNTLFTLCPKYTIIHSALNRRGKTMFHQSKQTPLSFQTNPTRKPFEHDLPEVSNTKQSQTQNDLPEAAAQTGAQTDTNLHILRSHFLGSSLKQSADFLIIFKWPKHISLFLLKLIARNKRFCRSKTWWETLLEKQPHNPSCGCLATEHTPSTLFAK